MLGPLEVRRSGHALELGRPKQRAVLAVLLLEANRVVPLDRLIDLLWGGEPPARATGALQVYISGLRRVLEPLRPSRSPARVLVTRAPGYLLWVEPGQLDAHRFETLAQLGHNLVIEGRPTAARHALVEALDLWQGPAYADFAFESFAQPEAARLEELRAVAVEDRIATELVLGNHLAVTADLEALVGNNPLRERLWAQLMLALYRSERQCDALRAYERSGAVLREELGVEPGPVLQRLRDDIRRQSPDLDWRPPERDHPLTLTSPQEERHEAPRHGPRRGVVGRSRELQLLDVVLTRAGRGTGALVLVSGEPGIGKTRLLEEVVTRAKAAGFAAAAGSCPQDEGAPSFWPWVEVLRTLLGDWSPEVLATMLRPVAREVAQIVPEVKETIPVMQAPAALDPANARFRLYEAVCELLAGMAQERPVVVVLDDLHWADVPTLQLTEYAAQRLHSAGVVLIAAFRDVDPAVGGRLADTLGALARHDHVERLSLGGLSPSEVAEFIAQTAGVQPSAELAAAVYDRTDGNPFFVAELARLLASERSLQKAGSLGGQVPAGVRDVIRRRLGRLPPSTNELLAQAAVLGREVDLRVLAAAQGVDEQDVVESIDASIAAGILVDDDGGDPASGLRFSHAMVQETIYAELGTARRTHLHAEVAEILRQLYGADESRVGEIAHHLYQAVPVLGPDDAYQQALRAAEVAQRGLAYEQAEWHLRRALELVSTMPATRERAARELDVQHRLAALLSVTEGYHASPVAQAWGRARELCREMGDTPEVLTSLWGLARLTRSRGQLDVSNQLATELFELAEGSDDPGFALAAHETRGLAAFFGGDPVCAEDHLTRAVALSEALPAAPGAGVPVLHPRVSCRAYLGCTTWLLGRDDTPDELLATARELARAGGHPLDEAIALLYSAKLATMRGEVHQTRALCAEVQGVAETTAIGPLAPVGVILDAWAGAHLGEARWDDRLSGALTQLRATGWGLAWTYFLALRADAARASGDVVHALAILQQALATAEATGERYYEPELHRLRGEITAGAGDPRGNGDAESSLRAAVAVATRQGAVRFRRRAEESLARLRS